MGTTSISSVSWAGADVRLLGAPRRAGGRYVLGERLGRGGMAEVFAGFAMGSLGFQKPVAIKRLLPELARDDEFVLRLVAEAKLLVGLVHGNVISVLDLVRDGDEVFLVMEYVDGPSLRQLINARRGAPLPLGLCAYIVQAACAGLEYAHARPGGAVIHADVSPSNVLLTTAGDVKVADFGIARPAGVGGVVEGKWAYMAPEQARGLALDARSDEFALGVVLYELLTGSHPFARRVSEHGRDEGAIAQVRSPRALRPDIPLHLEAACLRAMAPSPADRYARVQDLHDALAEIRFACQWREGAADLASAIAAMPAVRETAIGVIAAGTHAHSHSHSLPLPSRTQVTRGPVTLVTKSLLDTADPLARPTPLPGSPTATAGDPATHASGEATTPVPRVARWLIAGGCAAVLGAAIAVVVAALAPVGELPVVEAAPASAPASASASDVRARGHVTDPASVSDPDPVPVAVPAPGPDPVSASDPETSTATSTSPSPSKSTTTITTKTKTKTKTTRPPQSQAKASAPSEVDTGTVRISSEPWAYVLTENGRVETPATLTLTAGQHELVLYSPETGRRRTVWATVRANRTKTIRVRFEP